GDVLPARIDTGADITCIPEAAVKHLMPLLKGKPVIIRGHDGCIKKCATYFLSISLLGYPDNEQIETVTPERGVLLTDSNIVLVGADITSRFLVTMDGPKQMFSMSRH
ncbi:MAG TPA: hypothetical protein VMV86_01290, partial [Methanosarcinales archaeon]|nr:hypothetical protein [Methanosarcinales archaeon]